VGIAMKDIYEWIMNGKKTGPKILMLSPTDYCNLKCKTCWRLQKGMKFSQPSAKFLLKMISEAKNMGVETIDLTGGGEPFIRKDILKIMKKVKDLGMKGIMTSNATLIDSEIIKRIVEIGWDEINFSLDGSTEKINDYIRGKGVYGKCVKVIKELQEVKKKYNSDKPLIRISFTITSKNLHDIPNFIRFVNKLGVNDVYFSVLFEWDSNKELWVDRKRKKEVNKIFDDAIKLSEKFGIRTNLKVLRKHGLWEHKPPKFCFAPWYMLFVYADGKGAMCCTLASLHKNIVGDVKSLRKFWFGKKMESIRKKMLKGEFFSGCERCLPDFTEMFNRMYDEMRKWNSKK